MGSKWTEKREMFLRHYVTNGFNATAAARAVGYAHPNVAGPRLVNVSIFQEHLAAFCRTTHLSPDECTARLSRIARCGITEFYRLSDESIEVDWDKVLHGENRDLLQEIRFTAAGVILKGMNRLKALELIGKSHGLFAKRVLEERDERPISPAVLEQAVEDLRAYQRENEAIVRGWREAKGPAH